MGHLVGEAQLGHSGRAVAAADDGDGVRLGQGLGHGPGALSEISKLKYAHGPVPDDGARALDGGGVLLDGLGTDVHAHHAVGNGHGVVQLGLGVGGELLGALGVHRQEQLHALGLGFGDHLIAVVQPVALQQAGVPTLPPWALAKV